MHATTLSVAEIESGLQDLAGWTLVDGKLHRDYRFADFVRAFGFMASAALIAESMDHHPEWSNVYGRVTVDLYTHDARGITELDFRLAERLEALAGGVG